MKYSPFSRRSFTDFIIDRFIYVKVSKNLNDTKWKIIHTKPSIEDVRQMYAYHHYFAAVKVALLYPGEHDYISGNFVEIEKQAINIKQECGLMFVRSRELINDWQQAIVNQVEKWTEHRFERQ